MFEKQPEGLQQRVKELATQAMEESNPTAWFDVLYSQSQGDVTQIPWAKLTQHPYLQDWLTLSDPTNYLIVKLSILILLLLVFLVISAAPAV